MEKNVKIALNYVLNVKKIANVFKMHTKMRMETVYAMRVMRCIKITA